MDESSNERPIIIKKVKKVSGGGHHGGAWKVAYADFVTAMMAFFMLMWLLNATTEKQRTGIADYFTPTISIARVSGGGDGAFGGDSVFSENTLVRNGQGATMQAPAEEDKASGVDQTEEDKAEEEQFVAMDQALMGRGGESMFTDNELKHINSEITDEGLVIELHDLPDAPLFKDDTDEATPLLLSLTRIIFRATRDSTNDIAIEGHVAAKPIVMANNDIWESSSKRAQEVRKMFNIVGLPTNRINRVTGHADREPITGDLLSWRNNRLEIILLRDTKN